MSEKFSAVIAAGGIGSRFGGDIPKQFTEACGVPVIAHTLNKFELCELIDEIVIVTHKDYLVFCSDIVKSFSFTKVTSIIEGGTTRQQSVFKGIKATSPDADYVLIHDAARPVIDIKTIEKCCHTAIQYDSCAVGTKVVDTIKISEDGEFISATADRSKLWQIQTPQCFKRGYILKCHKNAAFENFEATDDCMLAEHYGARIKLVEGSRENLKITDYKDLAIVEVFLDD